MLSNLLDELADVPVCEDPPPPYTEQAPLLQRPAQSLDVPASSPATAADERHTSGRLIVGGIVIAHHIFNYVHKSLGTNTWGTRAIEYAMGVGVFASLVLLVKTFRLADAVLAYIRARVAGLGPPDAEAHRKLLNALVMVFSAAIPGMGSCIRSLYSGGSVKDQFLAQAFLGVSTFTAMVVVWWMSLRVGGVVARGRYPV